MTKEDLANVTFQSVESSNVREIGFAGETIFVRFKDGKLYSYDDCSQATFDAMLRSPSAGKFVHQVLKAKPSERIEG